MNKNTKVGDVEEIYVLSKDFNWNTKENRQLVDAFISIDDKSKMEAFLRDLMTESEIIEFSKRLEAARLLSRDTQYLSITERTGLSSATVARIAKWLRGPLGGYRFALSNIANLSQHHHPLSKLEKGLS
ncbi:MAG: YerC/YecD family TrpR-related protein [Candidatus Nomurabacteria bacterium]|nr:YerC/YecD family TrpR-related protein [Candidatus Nomurabacteria bacterium]